MSEEEALNEAESIKEKLQQSLGEEYFLIGLAHRDLAPVDQLPQKLVSMC